MRKLPQSWVSCRLFEISDVVTGKTPSKKHDEYFNGVIPFIKPGDIRNQGVIESTEETLTEIGADMVSCIPPDAITVTCIGNLGRVAITKDLSATNQQINSVIPNENISTKFLYYYLRTIKNWMESEASSTTVTIINKSRFLKAPVILPPANEQIRIADKLDSVLAKVDAAQARLEKIPALLKRFRQSVLAAATSGELTREWREENVLEDWKVKKIADIVTKIEAGKNISCDERPPEEGEFGIIKISAVTWGTYNEKESKTLLDNSAFLESRRVKVGDFLFSRANTLELVGMPIIVYSTSKNLMLSDKVLRLVMPDSEKMWLNFFMRSPKGRAEIESKATGNQLSMRNIGQKALLDIQIPYPSNDEKKEIVRRVESLFALADTVEKQYLATKQRLDRLTQSLLAKAFRGELVPQNPNDEPASELLARIKASRATEAPKQTRKPATRKTIRLATENAV